MMDKILHILQHSMGLDRYGRGTRYRNHFCTGPGSDDYRDCERAVELGLMRAHGPSRFASNDYLFSVTPEGDDYIRTHSERPPKQTRSQKRYADWLNADCGMRFGEWLKRST